MCAGIQMSTEMVRVMGGWEYTGANRSKNERKTLNLKREHDQFQKGTRKWFANNGWHEIRCSPVAPKVLLQANSHIPARSWTRPPQKIAMPTTTLGVATPRAWTLMRERMKVVDAKEKRPLGPFQRPQKKNNETENTHRGPGLPMREGRWVCVEGVTKFG